MRCLKLFFTMEHLSCSNLPLTGMQLLSPKKTGGTIFVWSGNSQSKQNQNIPRHTVPIKPPENGQKRRIKPEYSIPFHTVPRQKHASKAEGREFESRFPLAVNQGVTQKKRSSLFFCTNKIQTFRILVVNLWCNTDGPHSPQNTQEWTDLWSSRF